MEVRSAASPQTVFHTGWTRRFIPRPLLAVPTGVVPAGLLTLGAERYFAPYPAIDTVFAPGDIEAA